MSSQGSTVGEIICIKILRVFRRDERTKSGNVNGEPGEHLTLAPNPVISRA